MSSRPLVCLDPTNSPRPVATPRAAAARPASFDGAVVGLVSNTLGRSQELLAAVHRGLVRDSVDTAALEVVKPHKSVPPSPAQWEQLTRRATLAITGFGG